MERSQAQMNENTPLVHLHSVWRGQILHADYEAALHSLTTEHSLTVLVYFNLTSIATTPTLSIRNIGKTKKSRLQHHTHIQSFR